MVIVTIFTVIVSFSGVIVTNFVGIVTFPKVIVTFILNRSIKGFQ